MPLKSSTHLSICALILCSAGMLTAPAIADETSIQEELPIEFDYHMINIMRLKSNKVGDQYIGYKEADGFTNPCHITIKFTHSDTADYLHLQTILSGALTPGEYLMANNFETLGDMKYSYMPERYFPGLLVGSFGAGGPSDRKSYRIKSGSLNVDSIEGSLISGRIVAYGVTYRREQIGGETRYIETGQAPISVPFSVNGGSPIGRLGTEPYPCLIEGNIGTASQQPQDNQPAEGSPSEPSQTTDPTALPAGAQSDIDATGPKITTESILGKWLFTHMIRSGQKVPVNQTSVFHEDGTLVFYDSSDDETTRGTFKIQGDTLLYEDGRVSQSWKLISIGSDKMRWNRSGFEMSFEKLE